MQMVFVIEFLSSPLTSGNIPYPERFEKMIYTEKNAIVQNLSEQDISFDKNDSIDQGSNAMDLFDNRW